METTTETANRAYNRKLEAAQDRIAALGDAIAEHHRQQMHEPRHWGYAGDLDLLNELLDRALAAIGDTAAAERIDGWN